MEAKLQVLSSLSRYNLEFSGRALYVEFNSQQELDANANILSNEGIVFDDITETKIEIDLKDLGFSFPVFYDSAHFLKEFGSGNVLNSPFAIIFYNETYLLYENGTGTTGSKAGTFFITNTAAVAELKKGLINLCDYNNDIAHEMVFYTSSKGIFKLPYPVLLPHLDDSVDYAKIISKILEKLSDKNFQLFFRNQLADFTKRTQKDLFINLITQIDSLAKDADKDMELYIKNLALV